MKIILFQPQIPQNTGNIARTCSATGSGLVLVRPFGFSTHSRHLKRAGLDYWEGLDVEEIDDLDAYLRLHTSFFFLSSKSAQPYTEAHYEPASLLIFGSETAGLPPRYQEQWPDRFFTIPMIAGARCLNLANSAAIVLYEALRQAQFPLLEKREKKKERAAPITSEEVAGT